MLAAARRKSLELLARREHSRAELRGKLIARDFAEDVVTKVLDELDERNWISDRRFAEHYVAARRGRGFGPLLIRAELKRRGVAGEICSCCLDEGDPEWRDVALRALRRRFGESTSSAPRERAKQVRFLLRRGFGSDHVRGALDAGD